MLRTLQDELKNKLRAHRDLARRCAFVEDDETPEEAPCELSNDLNTMNDYVYRIQLPLHETATEASGQDTAQLISDIIDSRVRKVSTYRCEDDLDDPGCLTNRQIDALEEQLTARASAI
jgi:lipopolysaccharide biosynthesis regulator YciM